jgi:hypothetical protein
VVEVAEIVVHEGDESDFLAHLFDAHLLPSEHGAEIDFLPIEAMRPHAVTVRVLSWNGY